MKKMLALSVALFIVAPAVQAEDKTIAEIAVGNKDFSTLVAAAKAAGLVDALGGKGPITVFAPTNAAFEKLGKETIDKVLADKDTADQDSEGAHREGKRDGRRRGEDGWQEGERVHHQD